MTDYVTLSHDAFARTALVRHIAHGSNKRCCDWCGSPRWHSRDQQTEHSLFMYGTLRDDRGQPEWHRGLFCSKSCHDTYHEEGGKWSTP